MTGILLEDWPIMSDTVVPPIRPREAVARAWTTAVPNTALIWQIYWVRGTVLDMLDAVTGDENEFT